MSFTTTTATSTTCDTLLLYSVIQLCCYYALTLTHTALLLLWQLSISVIQQYTAVVKLCLICFNTASLHHNNPYDSVINNTVSVEAILCDYTEHLCSLFVRSWWSQYICTQHIHCNHCCMHTVVVAAPHCLTAIP
jgi:hypothetical protein